MRKVVGFENNETDENGVGMKGFILKGIKKNHGPFNNKLLTQKFK